MISDRLSPLDRGLAYGDGVFETMRTVNAQIPWWPRHQARLRAGCEALAIPYPDTAIEDALASLTGEGTGVCKLMVTRGIGGRGYLPPATVTPTVLVQQSAMPVWPAHLLKQGITTGLCRDYLHPEPAAGHKHLNRLPQVLARAEVARRGWHEGILLNPRQQPLEATSMNLFARIDDHWWTPDLQKASAGVNGVLRGWLLDHWQQSGTPFKVDLRPLSALRRADGVFLGNSVVGIVPVARLGVWRWPIPASVLALQAQVNAAFIEGNGLQ